jgi:hypothetical protein
VVILRVGPREALGVEDRELVHGLFPIPARATPIGRDVAQRQPDQFAGCVITREVSARLDDLAQPAFDYTVAQAMVDGVRGKTKPAPKFSARERSTDNGDKSASSNVVSMKRSVEEQLEASMTVLRDGLKLK